VVEVDEDHADDEEPRSKVVADLFRRRGFHVLVEKAETGPPNPYLYASRHEFNTTAM
jgi:hypothetical protein